jgi:hypothetical protein
MTLCPACDQDVELDNGHCPICYWDVFVDGEQAHEAGMMHGIDAYNEARGYDTEAPEPCGHHCPSDCPRCG